MEFGNDYELIHQDKQEIQDAFFSKLLDEYNTYKNVSPDFKKLENQITSLRNNFK